MHNNPTETPRIPEASAVERISAAEVERMQRAKDNLEPGSITPFDAWSDVNKIPFAEEGPTSPNYRMYQTLKKSRGMSVHGHLHKTDQVMEDFLIRSEEAAFDMESFEDADSHNAEFMTTYEALGDYSRNIQLLNKVGDILHRADQAQEDESFAATLSAARKDQLKILSEVVDKFKQANPAAELLPERSGSVEGIGAFIDFYKATYEKTLGSGELLAQLKDNKQLLQTALHKTSVVRGLGGQQNADRIRRAVAETPLVVIDPLSAIMELHGMDAEPQGWMMSAERVCYIDPLSIKAASPSKAGFDAELLKIMAHEYTHPASALVYRLLGKDSEAAPEAYAEPRRLWPDFFIEGMTEKIAYFLAANAAPELFKEAAQRSRGANELWLRELFSDNPAESLAPQYIKKLRHHVPSAYPSYRLLIDTMMSGADWESVGLTRAKADKLAISAFLEVDPEQSNLPNNQRKEFLHALSGATHPGFLVKLGALVDTYGTNLALDLLESPRFDYKNGDDLPWLASPSLRERLAKAQHKSKYDLSRLEADIAKKEQAGHPDFLLDFRRQKIESIRKLAQKGDMLDVATTGLARTLRSTHGSRKRHASAEDRLHRALLGIEPEESQHGMVIYENGVVEKSHKDVATWREEQTARRSGKWNTDTNTNQGLN